MSSIHPSLLIKGQSYDMVKTRNGVSIRTFLGKFVSCELTGRPYDPDAILTFELPNSAPRSFVWEMGSETFFEAETG
jgi:hypothetical protein